MSYTSSNSPQQNKPSRIFNCNLDSVDSVYELIKKVYSAITPKCASFPGKIRNYNVQNRKSITTFFTMPKAMRDYLFGNDAVPDIEEYDITYYCDKNLLKKEVNGKEEIFILVKMVKRAHH